MYTTDLLNGAIDVHVHVGPEAYKQRKYTEYQLAKEAVSAGAAAIVIKTHAFETASRAQLVQKSFPQIKILGGIALNEEVGGLNWHAVDAAADLGARIVWLPTLSSSHERKVNGRPGGIVCVKNGRTVAECDEIFRVIAERDIVLATGHLAPEEQFVVVDRAKDLGVKRILINHPALFRINMNIEMQKKLLPYGVFFERNYGGSRLPESNVFETHFERNFKDIRALGADSSIMATDLGQPNNCGWSEGFLKYISYMMEHGISKDDIIKMTRTNPAKLLGI